MRSATNIYIYIYIYKYIFESKKCNILEGESHVRLTTWFVEILTNTSGGLLIKRVSTGCLLIRKVFMNQGLIHIRFKKKMRHGVFLRFATVLAKSAHTSRIGTWDTRIG